MKIIELTLTNFGVYKGKNILPLAPRSEHTNIVLVGGLNGRGKTTVLDAVQIALYGVRATLVTNRREYEDLLRSKFSRTASTVEEFSLSLRFELIRDGVPTIFEIKRSWDLDSEPLRETVSISRDGALDQGLTEHSNDFIEEVLPIEISGLFLFDGEKIESLADPSRASKIILTAVNALLGTGLISRLQSDLRVLERRKLSEATLTELDSSLISNEEELSNLESKNSTLALEIASLQNDLDRQRIIVEEFDRRFEREGGTFFEGRRSLEEERRTLDRSILEVDSSLREVASGTLPLLLVEDLLDSIKNSDSLEHQLSRLETRQLTTKMVEALVQGGVLETSSSDSATDLMTSALTQMAEGALGSVSVSSHSISLAGDLCAASTEARRELDRLLQERESLSLTQDLLDRKLMAVPSESAIKEVFESRALSHAQLAQIEARHQLLAEQKQAVQTQIDNLAVAIEAARRKQALSDVANLDLARILQSSEKARDALEQWRSHIHGRNVHRIESEILTAYQTLIGKTSLVSELHLDPQTCEPSIRTSAGEKVFIQGLSAGERQLFAVATLWGLARVAGRELPTIIDTPLGRLDSVHRFSMVDDYFPKAAKQVILLSTDEEIDEALLAQLRPHLSHTVELRFNDKSDSSGVHVDSYFGGLTA